MWQDARAVDADSHVMEPGTLWRDYIDPEFREDCLWVRRDPHNGDKLMVEGRSSKLIPRLGGVRPAPDGTATDWNSLDLDFYVSYENSCTPPSSDPVARIGWMDAAGIDTTLLFPSLGLIWPREVDPCSPTTAAHLRAYNRWLLDFASAAPDRLIPVAQLSLTPEMPITTWAAAVAREGFRHVMLPIGASSVTDLDDFFGAAQEHDLTVHLHKVAIPHFLPLADSTTIGSSSAGRLFTHAIEILPGLLFLTALLDGRVPDRFPALRFAFHECNAGWLPAWIDRITESSETLVGRAQLPDLEPLSYFTERDVFFFSIGLGEELGNMPDWMFSRLMMATDYPHPGHPPVPFDEWTPILQELAPGHAAGLTYRNADRLHNGKG